MSRSPLGALTILGAVALAGGGSGWAANTAEPPRLHGVAAEPGPGEPGADAAGGAPATPLGGDQPAQKQAVQQQSVDFQTQIRPILAEKCFACHGPDAGARQAGLRLDLREGALAEADSGALAVVAGDPDASELMARATTDDPDLQMPPPQTDKALTADEVRLLKSWIEQGAPYAKHWAFVPPQRPEPPRVEDPSWAKNPIDLFVAQKLEENGLAPSPEAGKETLLRRLSLDLTGLPPTLAEIDAFLADGSADAYERQIERLLASPHYGERWGRLWLDACLYADSDGYEKDLVRSVWPYRDWVVDALNRDLPYDQFIAQQIAGDLLPGAGQAERIATGFLRNSTINEEGGIDPEEFRIAGNFERMEILGKAVLGLTVNCCQCHDHKYDPIPQEDYYRVFAYLNEAEEVNVAVYNPQEEATRAEVLREIERLEAGLRQAQPDWERFFAAWVDSQRSKATTTWARMKLKNFAIDNARRYLQNADYSVTSWGYNPPNTMTEFEGPSPVERVTAVRLETLTDPILPLGGPGRSAWGLFALTEMEIELAPADGSEPRKLEIASATADFANEPKLLDPGFEDPNDNKLRVTGPVGFAIDKKMKTAWGIDAGPGRSNVPRQAVFVLKEPLDLADGDKLRFVMRHEHGGYIPDSRCVNNIGRFRISVTDSPGAQADPMPKRVRDALRLPLDAWNPQQRAEAFSYWRTTVPEWQGVNEQIETQWRRHPQGTTQLAMAPRDQRRKSHVLERGDFLKPTKDVEPGVLSALHPLPESAPPDRRGLAAWLTDRQAPTTARSIVNRVWQGYFGTGIVATPDDFGIQGAAPTHPELLDWLAVELMDRGWRLKVLHRLIACSATYRQQSLATAELLERDPNNKLLARGPRVRLDGESLRDAAMATSGLLNRRLGGPPVFPPAPQFLFQPPASFGPKIWAETTGPERYRRSMYIFRFRSVPYPVLTTFDAPTGDLACVRRDRSNTPLQALITLNEPIFVECARGLAIDLLRTQPDDAKRIEAGFRRCVGRAPNPSEVQTLLKMLEQQKLAFSSPSAQPWLLAANDPARPPMLPSGATPAEAAAWTAVSRVMLNLDEAITKE